LKIFLPQLTILHAEYLHAMQGDQGIQFDLEHLAKMTKDDQVAFHSLAHSVVNDKKEHQFRTFENDFVFWTCKTWLIIGVAIMAAMALILSIKLEFKIR